MSKDNPKIIQIAAIINNECTENIYGLDEKGNLWIQGFNLNDRYHWILEINHSRERKV